MMNPGPGPQWIPVPPDLLMEALDVVKLGAGDDAEREALTHVPPALVAALAEYVGDGADCDHSVGICACEWAGIAHELRLALDGEQTCPACGGDGFLFDRERAVQSYRDAAARWGMSLTEAESMLGDSAGMAECSQCGSKGRAKLPV